MTPEQKAYYRMRIEQAKDETPSTGLFVWFVPVFVILAVLSRVPMAEVHHSQKFSLQDSAFVCVMGVCL